MSKALIPVSLCFLSAFLVSLFLFAGRCDGAGARAGDPELGHNTGDRLKAGGMKMGDPAFIRIFKEEMLLELWLAPDGTDGSDKEFKLFATYPICAMSGDLGPKVKQGDMQAPEGFYSVGLKALNPYSNYHLSFNLGYPNAYDRAHGRTGDYLMVHGNCVSAGCFAMTDLYITEIYKIVESALKSGQPFFRVHIFPFRLDEANLKRHADSRWAEFWRMLKPGYDYFEQHKTPPDIVVKNKQYVLSDKNRR